MWGPRRLTTSPSPVEARSPPAQPWLAGTPDSGEVEQLKWNEGPPSVPAGPAPAHQPSHDLGGLRIQAASLLDICTEVQAEKTDIIGTIAHTMKSLSTRARCSEAPRSVLNDSVPRSPREPRSRSSAASGRIPPVWPSCASGAYLRGGDNNQSRLRRGWENWMSSYRQGPWKSSWLWVSPEQTCLCVPCCRLCLLNQSLIVSHLHTNVSSSAPALGSRQEES